MTTWLVDTSAVWKVPDSADYTTWLDRIDRGLVEVCLPTWLEIARSARSAEHWPVLRRSLLSPLVPRSMTPRAERLAIDIAGSLVAAGLHRAVPVPDVMVAAVAAADGLTVLHDDRDFDRIAEVFGAPAVERLRL
jgi:hypothetical protein